MKRTIILGVALAALMAAVGQADAGRVGGQGVARGTLGPLASATYSEWFYGHETAVVAVCGNYSSQLRVTVYDHYGNYVTSATGYAPEVSWYPLATSRYIIQVTNLGYTSNSFGLATN